VAAGRVVTVPLPIEPQFAQVPRTDLRRDGCRRLLYSGRLIAIKGLAPFLAALARCARSMPECRVQMTFLGNGPERRTLARIEVPRNLSVVFENEVPYVSMPTVYSRHDVLVLPTFADTWGQVVSESMACGLPVLGSRRSQAAEELVEDGVTGWLFDPVSQAEMETAIRTMLLTGEAAILSMGAAAQAVARRLTPSESADAMATAINAAQRIRQLGGVAGRKASAAEF